MKRFILGVLCLTVIFASWSVASASLYYWTDDKGKLHINNDIKDVPEKYRDSIKVLEGSKPSESKPAETKPPASYEPAPSQGSGAELFDGHDARWWKYEYDDLRRRTKSLVDDYSNKKQFVDLFERGRRMGQFYEKKEVDTYLQYKDELAPLEEKIKSMNEAIEDFKRKARYYGVPKEAVGD